MGIDNYTYIGAYVDVPEITETTEVDKYRCSNTVCKNHKDMANSNKFCPACGSAGEEYKKPITLTQSLNLYELAEKHNLSEDDLFQVNDGDQWIPNSAYGGTKFTYDKHSNDGAKKIKAQDIDKSIAAFKSKYKSFIDAVKTEYDFDLEINFGVVSYYM